MSLQGLQQLCGFNTLMYFSATIFDALGMSNGTATGLLIAAVNFIFTVVSLKVSPQSQLLIPARSRADIRSWTRLAEDGRCF